MNGLSVLLWKQSYFLLTLGCWWIRHASGVWCCKLGRINWSNHDIGEEYRRVWQHHIENQGTVTLSYDPFKVCIQRSPTVTEISIHSHHSVVLSVRWDSQQAKSDIVQVWCHAVTSAFCSGKKPKWQDQFLELHGWMSDELSPQIEWNLVFPVIPQVDFDAILMAIHCNVSL